MCFDGVVVEDVEMKNIDVLIVTVSPHTSQVTRVAVFPDHVTNNKLTH